MNTLTVALSSIVLSVAAQFALKAGMSRSGAEGLLAQPIGLHTLVGVVTNGYLVVGFLIYGLAAVVWLEVLSRWDVSKAYPLVGLGFVVTLVAGAMAGESLSMVRVAGVALICFGVILVSQS